MRFESMADMPAGMRDLYAKKVLAGMPAEQTKPEKKPAKYRNSGAERGGIHFDSQKEARRYDELLLMLRDDDRRHYREKHSFFHDENYMKVVISDEQ